MAMAQRLLVYSFVARKTVILAEYHSTEMKGNLSSIAVQCLQKLLSSNSNTKFTYAVGDHTLHFIVDDGYTYCVVAVESAGRELPMGFLERIKEDFERRYGGGRAAAAAADGLSREYGPKMKEHMQYCYEHPEELSRLAKVKAQVSEVKEVMKINIDKVIEREGKIDDLVVKTDELRSKAQVFKQHGTQLRRKFWWQNMKIKLIVLVIIIALILIIVLSICKGFKC